MVNELTQRKDKLSKQLSDLENQPRATGRKKRSNFRKFKNFR